MLCETSGEVEGLSWLFYTSKVAILVERCPAVDPVIMDSPKLPRGFDGLLWQCATSDFGDMFENDQAVRVIVMDAL